MAKFNAQRGFTLMEVLIALALVSMISLVVMGSIGPWMALKNKLDTERKLQDIKNGITSLYVAKAMAIEGQGGGQLDAFRSSTPSAGNCAIQVAAFEANADRFSDSPGQIARDGYGSPWCVFISPAISEIKDGVNLYYRNVSFVSGGPNGIMDEDTVANADGTVTLGGDDLGVTISGRDVQAEKLKETLRRMNRVASMYETYFTTRYLANPARDISVYYFSRAGDASSAVESTNGSWAPAATALQSVGVSATDAYTPWEANNRIEVANFNESAGGAQVRSPSTTGSGVLPYTALLRARLPSPAATPSYAVQTVIGNY